uniref:Uncharacterized protein MANES_06G020600 n=1 Tax=Rhizophora mucronata TaxID=61149 RepID=A0A2P2LYK9_RHIMU
MGACFSCRSSPEEFKNIIRVVHLDGYVEDFEYPVSVREVTGKSQKRYVCTGAELLSLGPKPLKPDAQLERGRIYFLLPRSTLEGDTSPMEFAPMVRRLTSIAKSSHFQAKSPGTGSPLSTHQCLSPLSASCPNQFMETAGASPMTYGGRSWKPVLDTIRERSFNRRSESEMLEIHLETLKED